MKTIDEKIREAMSQEDAELVEDLQGERPLHEMITETFHGRHRWLHITAFVMPMVFLLLVFVFGFKFYYADSTRTMITWATGFLWAVTAMGMFKIMYMMELNKNSVTREIKRLELELAQLSRRLSEK